MNLSSKDLYIASSMGWHKGALFRAGGVLLMRDTTRSLGRYRQHVQTRALESLLPLFKHNCTMWLCDKRFSDDSHYEQRGA